MRMVMLALVAASVAACANDVTAPTVQPAPENSLTDVNGSAGRQFGFGRRGFGMAGPFALRRLPANLALTETQRAQIKTLMTSFRTAHRDDLQSLASAWKQARAARTTGETADQRRALFAQTAPQRQRLMTAHQQLASQVQQVLTADQRAWLTANRPSFRHSGNRSRVRGST